MTDTTDMVEQALSYLAAGFNCAEAVLLAVSQAHGIDEEYLYHIASGLGGGIASQGEVCGAVTGGVLAAGLLYGPGETRTPVDKAAMYARAGEYVRRFEAAHGAVRCRDLIGVDLTTPEGKQAYRDQNLSACCQAFVASGVRKLEALFDEWEGTQPS